MLHSVFALNWDTELSTVKISLYLNRFWIRLIRSASERQRNCINTLKKINLWLKFKALGKKKNKYCILVRWLITDSLTQEHEHVHGTEKQMGSDKIKHKTAALHHVSDFGYVCVYLLWWKWNVSQRKKAGGFIGDLWPVPIATQMAFGSSLSPPGFRQRAQSSGEETRVEEESPWFSGDSDVNPGWSRALMALSCPLNFSSHWGKVHVHLTWRY